MHFCLRASLHTPPYCRHGQALKHRLVFPYKIVNELLLKLFRAHL